MDQCLNGDLYGVNLMFSGIHAMQFAMFREDEQLDHDAMAQQIDYCIANGCQGISVLGLATEVQKLTQQERIDLIGITAQALNKRRTFSVTISGNSVAEQVALIRCAEQNQADWLIIQPPIAGQYNADVYLDFFARVMTQTTLPVGIQNAPAYLGRALSAQDIDRLRKRCPNFLAIKSEESALGVGAMIESVGDQLTILGGRGGLEMTDLLRLGCSGFVFAPDFVPVAAMINKLWQANEHDKAEKLYASAAPSIVFTMQSLEHLITYGKRVFGSHANLKIYDRAPSLGPTEQGLTLTSSHADRLRHLQSCGEYEAD